MYHVIGVYIIIPVSYTHLDVYKRQMVLLTTVPILHASIFFGHFQLHYTSHNVENCVECAILAFRYLKMCMLICHGMLDVSDKGSDWAPVIPVVDRGMSNVSWNGAACVMLHLTNRM